MNIIPLPAGDRAPETTDCLRIQELESGEFALSGTVRPRADEDEESDSISLLEENYPSYEEAEAAGLAWAAEQGVESLYLSVSYGTEPLPDLP